MKSEVHDEKIKDQQKHAKPDRVRVIKLRKPFFEFFPSGFTLILFVNHFSVLISSSLNKEGFDKKNVLFDSFFLGVFFVSVFLNVLLIENSFKWINKISLVFSKTLLEND